MTNLSGDNQNFNLKTGLEGFEAWPAIFVQQLAQRMSPDQRTECEASLRELQTALEQDQQRWVDTSVLLNQELQELRDLYKARATSKWQQVAIQVETDQALANPVSSLFVLLLNYAKGIGQRLGKLVKQRQ